MNCPIKISVVIPSKNRAHTLPTCLESVLNQSFPPAEVIIVDDGSTDDPAKVVKKYKDYGVLYVPLPEGHGGAQAARNYGVQIASHEWIAFQDSDDLWLKNKLLMQIEALREKNFDRKIVVHANGLKKLGSTGTELPICIRLTEGQCFEQLLLNPGPMFQALLASKDAILSAGGLDDNCPSHQEWDTAIRLSRNCEFVHIQEPVFIWNWHEGETISKDLKRSIVGFNYIVNRYKNDIIKHCGYQKFRKMKIKVFIQACHINYWVDAKKVLINEGWHPSYLLALFLAYMHIKSNVTDRLLRLFTLI